MMADCVQSMHEGSTSHLHQNTLCRQLWNLRSNASLCDVFIKVGGEWLAAHRIVLSACSPVLLSVFGRSDKPIDQRGENRYLEIEKCSYGTCRSVLEFMYTGKVPVFKSDLLKEFSWIIKHWQLHSLNELRKEDLRRKQRIEQLYAITHDHMYFELVKDPAKIGEISTTRTKTESQKSSQTCLDSSNNEDGPIDVPNENFGEAFLESKVISLPSNIQIRDNRVLNKNSDEMKSHVEKEANQCTSSSETVPKQKWKIICLKRKLQEFKNVEHRKTVRHEFMSQKQEDTCNNSAFETITSGSSIQNGHKDGDSKPVILKKSGNPKHHYIVIEPCRTTHNQQSKDIRACETEITSAGIPFKDALSVGVVPQSDNRIKGNAEIDISKLERCDQQCRQPEPLYSITHDHMYFGLAKDLAKNGDNPTAGTTTESGYCESDVQKENFGEVFLESEPISLASDIQICENRELTKSPHHFERIECSIVGLTLPVEPAEEAPLIGSTLQTGDKSNKGNHDILQYNGTSDPSENTCIQQSQQTNVPQIGEPVLKLKCHGEPLQEKTIVIKPEKEDSIDENPELFISMRAKAIEQFNKNCKKQPQENHEKCTGDSVPEMKSAKEIKREALPLDHRPENVKILHEPKPDIKSAVYKEEFLCALCLMLFNEKAELTKHRNSVHKAEESLSCDICELGFSTQNMLLVHNFQNHWKEGMEQPINFTCTFKGCKFETYTESTLNSHRENKHSQKPNCVAGQSCRKVCKDVQSQNKRKKKVRRREEKGERTCSHCNFTSTTSVGLAEHIFKIHNLTQGGNAGYECSICGFRTLRRSTLKDHQNRKACQNKPFVCNVCGRRYFKETGLQKHMTFHSGDAKLFHCPHCDYVAVNSKATLQTHVQLKHLHKGEKRFPCDECSYACNYKGNLYKHLRTVHGRSLFLRPPSKKIRPSHSKKSSSPLAKKKSRKLQDNSS